MRLKYAVEAEVELPAGTQVTLATGVVATIKGAAEGAPTYFRCDYEDDDIGWTEGQFDVCTLPASIFPGRVDSAAIEVVQEPPSSGA